MAGIKDFFRCLNNIEHGHFCNYHINLHLWQQVDFRRNSAVEFRLAFLGAEPQHMSYSHSRNANIIHCRLKFLKPAFFHQHSNFRKLNSIAYSRS